MTLNELMVRFSQWLLMIWSVLFVILVFLRQNKRMRQGKYSDEFVDRWAEDWVKKHKDILERME